MITIKNFLYKLITGVASSEEQKAASSYQLFGVQYLLQYLWNDQSVETGTTSSINQQPSLPLAGHCQDYCHLLVPTKIPAACATEGGDSTGAVFIHTEEGLPC